MLTAIKTIFFDLDNTIFDHTRAERDAILALVRANPNIFQAIVPEDFLKVYHEVNKALWKQMANGEITTAELKRLRFEISLKEFEGDPGHADALSQQFFDFYSRQDHALPNARKILDYLKPKYDLGILSNGFPEIQEKKTAQPWRGSLFQIQSLFRRSGRDEAVPGNFSRRQAALRGRPE